MAVDRSHVTLGSTRDRSMVAVGTSLAIFRTVRHRIATICRTPIQPRRDSREKTSRPPSKSVERMLSDEEGPHRTAIPGVREIDRGKGLATAYRRIDPPRSEHSTLGRVAREQRSGSRFSDTDRLSVRLFIQSAGSTSATRCRSPSILEPPPAVERPEDQSSLGPDPSVLPNLSYQIQQRLFVRVNSRAGQCCSYK